MFYLDFYLPWEEDDDDESKRIVKDGKQTKFDKFEAAGREDEAFEEEDPKVYRTRQSEEVAQCRGRKKQGQACLDEAERPQAKTWILSCREGFDGHRDFTHNGESF